MRRKVIKRIDSPGRDHGKAFLITEMSSYEGEIWATQALMLLARANVDVAEPGAGMAGLAATELDFREVAQLHVLQDSSLDAALWKCVQYVHDPANPPQPIIDGEGSQIEEIATRSILRVEVLKLQLGFSKGAEPSNSAPRPTRAA